ncbi:MAG: bifunctional DNA primase/polymerase [Alphaproteobacteria bacterium]
MSQQVKRITAKVPTPPATGATLLDWALWCAEVGRTSGAWKVFPCIPGEKRPLHKGWQDEAASDRKTVETMWQNDPLANIGLAIQPGFLALDCDLYKPGAEAALATFEAEHGDLPRTFESNTPSGGIHLIYSATKTVGNGTGSLPDFGDVRGYGGFIVGPGSRFSGQQYTVGLATAPTPLPAHIEAMLRETKTRDRSKPDVPVQGVAVDDPRNVKCFTDWCAGLPVHTSATPSGRAAEPCIEGQGGNNRLVATGAMAHDYGLSPDKALEIALEHYNPRCEPPWDDDQFEITFLSGYKSATGELGSRAPACDYGYLFKPVLATLDGKIVNGNASLVSPPADYPLPMSASELVAGNFPRATYALQDFILERQVNLLYGDGGTGKTLLALHMAVAIAAGLSLFGHKTIQSPALLVLAEDGFGEAKARLTAICDTLGVNLATLPLTVWCLPGSDVNLACIRDDGTWTPGPFMTPLQNMLGKLGPSFLVLDTVSDIASLDETKRLPVNTLAKKVLTGLCRDFGATILVNAHPSKAAMSDGSGYAGSTAWNNAVRNRLSLERDKGKGQRRILKVAKANYGSEAELELFLLGQTFTTLSESGQSPEIEREAVLQVTLDLIDKGISIVRSHGVGQKPKDLAKEIKQRHGLTLSQRSVLDHLNALERQGSLTYEKSDNGKRGHRTGFHRSNGHHDAVG